jgi:exoribonuclease-2
MQDNAAQIAWLLEEQNGRLRLLLPNRRELSIHASRLLPWSGPAQPGVDGREAAVGLLLRHRELREKQAASLDVVELWHMAQGEMTRASALWMAELGHSAPDVDTIAACGHALLECKTHFKFQSPEFEIFPEETVARRVAEQNAKRLREELNGQGNAWLQLLWEVHAKKRRDLPEANLSPDVADTLRALILRRIADPEQDEDAAQWRLLTRNLPEDPLLPLHLAQAWGLRPPHYNFWMDRADYPPGDAWAEVHARIIETLVRDAAGADLPDADTPFISVDNATTRDIDDAFSVSSLPEGGWQLELALACPALHWPFAADLDRAVMHRATSIYLPEATHHMLPERLALEAYALTQHTPRPALVVRCAVAPDGAVRSCTPFVARIRIAANLTYDKVEAALDGRDSAAAVWAEPLRLALDLARTRQAGRLERGAVIIERPDPQFVLTPQGDGPDAPLLVELLEEPQTPKAHLVVSEFMILANAELAGWMLARDMPLLYRTQDVPVPREYAGVWHKPHDIARVVRALAPASLETAPRPHAGLGEEVYAPTTSPLRRYPDLINEAQIVSCLQTGAPRWSRKELDEMLVGLNPRLDAAGQVQRMRPRYWKLLYIQQQGDKAWWPAVITDENEAFVSISLPREQMSLRARRNLFGDRTRLGQEIEVRLHKVYPLHNDVQIAEVREPSGSPGPCPGP